MKPVISVLPWAALALAQGERPATQVPLTTSTIDSIPLLGFGTWNLDRSNVTEAVSYAIETGYRHIDCAAAYGNEDLVGRGIAHGLLKASLKREDIWVTSKLWNNQHGSNNPERAIDETLSRLGVGYLDLYLMHWPVSQGFFGNKEIEYLDTWGAMTLLLQKGKARRIGVSNFSPEQLEELLNHTSYPPSVHQMEMHPYLQQNDWRKFHEDHGIHVTAYSPFAGTNPTYDPGEPVPIMKNEVLKRIAKDRGCTPAQVALQWGMSRGTSVIPKSSHKEYIEQNFGASKCELKKHDLEAIDELGSEHYRFSNPSKSWGLNLYNGLEDSRGEHKLHS